MPRALPAIRPGGSAPLSAGPYCVREKRRPGRGAGTLHAGCHVDRDRSQLGGIRVGDETSLFAELHLLRRRVGGSDKASEVDARGKRGTSGVHTVPFEHMSTGGMRTRSESPDHAAEHVIHCE